jgi:glycosyltransferase involved in cell wall biosynthesis
MKIAVIARSLFVEKLITEKAFIEDLLSTLVCQNKSVKLLIIADKKAVFSFSNSSNIEFLDLGSAGKTVFQNKYWWEIKLPRILKKNKTDFLISFDGQCSKTLKLPQILSGFEVLQSSSGNTKKAKIVIVNSKWEKEEIEKIFNIQSEKVAVMTIAVKELYKPVEESEREKTKATYCGGKEYFLYPEKLFNGDSFISLLKSFSHFKKRQQSNMKLMLFSKPSKKYLESLASYKFRNDVVIIENPNDIEEASLIGSSYAVIIPQSNSQSIFKTLKSLQSAVPILASENSPVREYASDAALYFENETEKGIAEKMIRIYSDENLRTELIRKGKNRAKNFTIQKSADLLWDCIQTAVK